MLKLKTITAFLLSLQLAAGSALPAFAASTHTPEETCKGLAGINVNSSIDFTDLSAQCQTYDGSKKSQKAAKTLTGIYGGIFGVCLAAGIMCSAGYTAALGQAMSIACGALGLGGTIAEGAIASGVETEMSKGLKAFKTTLDITNTLWSSYAGIGTLFNSGSAAKDGQKGSCATSYVSAAMANLKMIQYNETKKAAKKSESASKEKIAKIDADWESAKKTIDANRPAGYSVNNDGYQTAGSTTSTASGSSIGSATDSNGPESASAVVAAYEPGLNIAALNDPKFQNEFKKLMGMNFNQFSEAVGNSENPAGATVDAMKARGVLSEAGASALKQTSAEYEQSLMARKAEDVSGGRMMAGSAGSTDAGGADALAGMPDLQSLFKQLNAAENPEQAAEAQRKIDELQHGANAQKMAAQLEQNRAVSIFDRVGYRYRKKLVDVDTMPWSTAYNQSTHAGLRAPASQNNGTRY